MGRSLRAEVQRLLDSASAASGSPCSAWLVALAVACGCARHGSAEAQVRGDMLISMARSGSLEGVKRIIKPRPHLVNYSQTGGKTALHVAAEYGHKEVVLYLLSSGADARMRDKYDRTPSDYARLRGHAAIVALLPVSRKTQ